MIHAAIEAAATITVRPATALTAYPVNWPELPFIIVIPRPIITNTPSGSAISEIINSPNSVNFFRLSSFLNQKQMLYLT